MGVRQQSNTLSAGSWGLQAHQALPLSTLYTISAVGAAHDLNIRSQHTHRVHAFAPAPRRSHAVRLVTSPCHFQGSAMDDPDTAMTRAPADEEPFSALAFKVMSDKYVGTLTFCRVYRCSPLCEPLRPVLSRVLLLYFPWSSWRCKVHIRDMGSHPGFSMPPARICLPLLCPTSRTPVRLRAPDTALAARSQCVLSTASAQHRGSTHADATQSDSCRSGIPGGRQLRAVLQFSPSSIQ